MESTLSPFQGVKVRKPHANNDLVALPPEHTTHNIQFIICCVLFRGFPCLILEHCGTSYPATGDSPHTSTRQLIQHLQD